MSVQLVAPWPVLDHLERLTDRRGLFEHARYDVPRREHGYCVDDVARGLVVVCRERNTNQQVNRLAGLYLGFVVAAIEDDGASHNRMNTAGEWTDAASFDDCWGRALWGLGVASAHAPTPLMRAQAGRAFRRAAVGRSPHLRATVFAALGAGALLIAEPGDQLARRLLEDVVARIGPSASDAGWPWPEPRLAYGNGAVVEALLLAGTLLPDPAASAQALALLDFLVRTESREGHLSPTPVGGRARHDTAVAFDQQPIEVAALADACARAFALTGDTRWLDAVRTAWAWFLGDNDSRTPMFDPRTGGGFDGLTRDGANLNQGAESTLAMLSTAQQAQRFQRHR